MLRVVHVNMVRHYHEHQQYVHVVGECVHAINADDVLYSIVNDVMGDDGLNEIPSLLNDPVKESMADRLHNKLKHLGD